MHPHGGERSAIVSVGNELLFGETVDTNAAWLGRTLAQLGLPVVRRFTVGDVAADIQDAVRAAMDAAEVVIVSGGLGPTADDLTKPSVASLLGRELVADEAARVAVERRFLSSGHTKVPKLGHGQSEVPAGAVVLENRLGTAPGLWLDHDGRCVVLLPGVPRELKGIVQGPLRPRLEERVRARGGLPVHHVLVRTTGIPESRLAEQVDAELEGLPAEVLSGVDLAYLPDLLGVELRFSARSRDPVDARERIGRLLAALETVLAPWRFEAESGDLVEALLEALRARGLSLAVAESCTGGLALKRLTDRPGASQVIVGGVVAYANETKVQALGVPSELIERDGAVSESVARAMAVGVAERLGTAAGIGITGVAGPGGGTDDKPVGTVWIAVSVDGEVTAQLGRFGGDREAVRTRAAQAALAQLFRRLT